MVEMFFTTIVVSAIVSGGIGYLKYRHDLLSLEESQDLREANKLMVCRDCGRYSRFWQQRLECLQLELDGKEPESYGVQACPHCQTYHNFKGVDTVYGWMDSHPDCIKLPDSHLRKYNADKKLLLEEIRNKKELEAFQDYNKLHAKDPFDLVKEIRESKEKKAAEKDVEMFHPNHNQPTRIVATDPKAVVAYRNINGVLFLEHADGTWSRKS